MKSFNMDNAIDKMSLTRNERMVNQVSDYDAVFNDYLDRIDGCLQETKSNVSGLVQKLEHIKEDATADYYQALMYPEKTIHCKIPGMVPWPTSSFKIHNTVTITPNASGNFAFLFNPYFLQKTGTANGTFFLNNNASLTGSGASDFFTSTDIGLSIPDIYAEYRLVSASVIVTNKASVLNNSGNFSASAIVDPNVIHWTHGLVYTALAQYGNFSYIDDAFYNQINASKDGIRMLYFPLDPTFEQFQVVGTPKAGFTFGCYGQSLQASTPSIRVDIYLNYEGLPNPVYFQYIPRSMPSYASSDSKNKAIQDAKAGVVSTYNGLSSVPTKNGKTTTTVKDVLETASKTLSAIDNASEFAIKLKEFYDKATKAASSLVPTTPKGFNPADAIKGHSDSLWGSISIKPF